MNDNDAAKFRKAVWDGDIKIVQKLLVDVDAKRDKALLDNALAHASFRHRMELVDLLLKAGANPEQKTSIGTLLMCGAMGGELQLVKRLIEAGADPNRELKRETALTAALSENAIPVIEYLEGIGAYAPPTTALLYAAMHGDVDRARKALKAGAELEKTGGTFDETPLVAAAREAKTATIKLLLEHGANPNQKARGTTALHSAVRYGKDLAAVEALVAGGADIHAKHDEETVLMAAAQAGSLPIVKRLVELGAKIDARDTNSGRTALDHATGNKHKEVIAYLTGLGAAANFDSARAMTRALAREFGGRAQEHSHGFSFNSRLAGFKCQFRASSDDAGVAVFGMKYLDAEIRQAKSSELIIRPNPPTSRHGKVKEVKSASKVLGVKVWRSVGTEAISEEFVEEFCKRHLGLLNQLQLSGNEYIGIYGLSTRFCWSGTDIKVVLPRLQKFGELIQAISRAPRTEIRLFEAEWVLKPLPKGFAKGLAKDVVPRHSFGGKLEQAVGCPECGGRTNLMANVDLSDPALPKNAFGGCKLPVFWCLTCLEWSPMFYDVSGNLPRPIDASGKPVVLKSLGEGEEDLPVRPLMLVAVPAGKKAGRKSKLGGAPSWIQLEETPDCPKCESPMAFALQLVSDSSISYSDAGLLYAFACPECKVTASLVQSH